MAAPYELPWRCVRNQMNGYRCGDEEETYDWSSLGRPTFICQFRDTDSKAAWRRRLVERETATASTQQTEEAYAAGIRTGPECEMEPGLWTILGIEAAWSSKEESDGIVPE